MRKYRGQRIDKKEWVYGYLFKIWDKTHILWGTTNNIPNMIEVIPSTVGQQVGTKDWKGVEIYEGDIVKFSSYYLGDSTEPETIQEIKYEENSFNRDLTVGYQDYPEWCEVIGNITDNPELMNL